MFLFLSIQSRGVKVCRIASKRVMFHSSTCDWIKPSPHSSCSGCSLTWKQRSGELVWNKSLCFRVQLSWMGFKTTTHFNGPTVYYKYWASMIGAATLWHSSLPNRNWTFKNVQPCRSYFLDVLNPCVPRKAPPTLTQQRLTQLQVVP